MKLTDLFANCLLLFIVLVGSDTLLAQPCPTPPNPGPCNNGSCEVSILANVRYPTFYVGDRNCSYANQPYHYSKIVFTVRTGSGTTSDVNLQVEFDNTKFDFLSQYPSDFYHVATIGTTSYYRTNPVTFGFDNTVFYEIPIAEKATTVGQSLILNVDYSLINSSGCQPISQDNVTFLPYKAIGTTGQSTSLTSLLNQTIPPLRDPVSAMTNKQTFNLYGTLIIDQDYTFGRDQGPRDGSEIHMQSGAKIVVTSGTNLLLDGAEFYGCTELWDRIELEPGASLTARNCYFEDAQYAIYLSDGYPAVMDGEVNFVNCEFTDNIYSIYTPPHVLPQSPTEKIRFNIRDFHSNYFLADDAGI